MTQFSHYIISGYGINKTFWTLECNRSNKKWLLVCSANLMG